MAVSKKRKTKRKAPRSAFKKGNQAAKGHGRPKLPPELQLIKKLKNTEVKAIMNKYLAMDLNELAYVLKKNNPIPMIDRIIAGIIYEASEERDHSRFDFLLNRVVGKVPDQKDFNFNFNFEAMPTEEVIEIGKDAIKYLKAHKDKDDE
jgi:hypothetical protein